MTPAETQQFVSAICGNAGRSGLKLSLTPNDDGGYSYQWSNGIGGKTNADTASVALLMACLTLHDFSV